MTRGLLEPAPKLWVKQAYNLACGICERSQRKLSPAELRTSNIFIPVPRLEYELEANVKTVLVGMDKNNSMDDMIGIRVVDKEKGGVQGKEVQILLKSKQDKKVLCIFKPIDAEYPSDPELISYADFKKSFPEVKPAHEEIYTDAVEKKQAQVTATEILTRNGSLTYMPEEKMVIFFVTKEKLKMMDSMPADARKMETDRLFIGAMTEALGKEQISIEVGKIFFIMRCKKIQNGEINKRFLVDAVNTAINEMYANGEAAEGRKAILVITDILFELGQNMEPEATVKDEPIQA